MCQLCNSCIHSHCRKGATRGVMDCDPDEYWCNEDNYKFYMEDEDIIEEAKQEYIDEQIANGCTSDEARTLAEETDFEVDCCDYSELNYDDDGYYDDGYYLEEDD